MEKLKVLLPTDFSVQAEYAYLMVKKLEAKLPLEVHFLHVMNVPDTVTMDGTGTIQTCGEIDPNYVFTQAQIARRKLENLKVLYGDQIHVHFMLGKVTDSILKFSAAEKFDLIVMGTKGSWGLRERLSGSETQMIARKSDIPVLSLMCDRSDLTIKQVLLVHNFSDEIPQDLKLLRRFVTAFGTQVHLLQITANANDANRAAIEADMKKFAAKQQIEDFHCHILTDLDVENGVNHFIQMMDMDIVCIGTHGKGGLFHHSATEKLINHLYKPILSFHLN
jgi:nucleotide-binding universal stress UspA family protein